MQRGMFIRHLNGNTSDSYASNLAECTIYEALVHIDEWSADWVCFLNEDEKQFVRENVESMIEMYVLHNIKI